jgi:hypothetical protein
MGLGDDHDKRDVYHTSHRNGNWKQAQLHSSRTRFGDELQLPADCVSGDTQRRRGIRKPFEYRLRHNHSLGNNVDCSSSIGYSFTLIIELARRLYGSTLGDHA